MGGSPPSWRQVCGLQPPESLRTWGHFCRAPATPLCRGAEEGGLGATGAPARPTRALQVPGPMSLSSGAPAYLWGLLPHPGYPREPLHL